jgi:hypothetical protein
MTPLQPLDAVGILRKEHARLAQLFVDFFALQTESRRYDLIPCICDAVKAHMELDAEIFCPHLASATGEAGLAQSAAAEYAAVKDFLEELAHPDPGDDQFVERVHRLATLVSHHIREAEKSDGAFAKALSSDMDCAAVGHVLRKRQREWMLDQARRRCS